MDNLLNIVEVNEFIRLNRDITIPAFTLSRFPTIIHLKKNDIFQVNNRYFMNNTFFIVLSIDKKNRTSEWLLERFATKDLRIRTLALNETFLNRKVEIYKERPEEKKQKPLKECNRFLNL
jgi:hypothetical protein